MWTELILENGKYVNPPQHDVPVLAILRWGGGKLVPAIIKYVSVDDHNWETVDDNS